MSAPATGTVGIWSLELRFGDPGEAGEAIAELDELGYGAVWVPGGIDGGVLHDMERLLAATRRTTIAAGIVNVWKNPAQEVATWFAAQPAAWQARTLLGLGVSHSLLIGESWGKPLTLMREYLDALDAAGMSRDHTCLAALGPKMTELSRDRTFGSHPYLTTPEHSRGARAILDAQGGTGKLLAPEQGVVLDADPARARAAARKALDHYRYMPNYVNSWKRLGFAEADIADLSDGLIDAIFAWGTAEQIAARVHAHLDAGADHVCVQVIPSGEATGFAAVRPAWRELAAVLLG